MKIIVIDQNDKVIGKIHGYFRRLHFEYYDKTHTMEFHGVGSGRAALERIISDYQQEAPCDLIITTRDTGDLSGLELGKRLMALEIAPAVPIVLYVDDPEKFLKDKDVGSEITLCCKPFDSYESCEKIMEKVCAVLISREVESRIEKVDALMEKQGTDDFIATLENYYMHSARNISVYKSYAPWSELPYKSLADIYIGSNKHRDAIPYLKTALKINYHNYETHKNLALCYRKIGLSFEELEELRTTLCKFPHSSPTLLKIGEALLREGDYLSAAEHFKQAIAFHKPADTYRLKARSHVGLGKAYMADGDENNDSSKHEMAKDEFKNAVHVDPMLLAAYNNLIIVYNKLGMVEEAAETMARAVKLLPDDSDGWLNLFEIYLREGEERKAKHALRKIIRSEPENQIILCTAAETYMRQEMFSDAIELFKNALKVNPSGIRIHNFMGICFRRLGEYEEAISHYRKALQIDPSDCNIHFNLGQAYWSAKKLASAEKCFKTAVQLDPEFDEAKKALLMIADHPDPDDNRRAGIR